MKTNHLLLIALLIVTSCKSQSFNNASIIQKHIDKNANELLQNKSINSVAIGVYLNKKEISSYYGELDPEKNNQPTDSTIYTIASVTKTMTGFLVAKAVLDKKINLEDDIRIYLKNNYNNLSYQNQPIKIKHLLTHTSGLPAELVGLEKFLNIGDIKGALQFVNKYTKPDFFKDLKTITLKSSPGTSYLYSSNGTNLMGYILENVYKKTYAQLLQEYIFDNAKMTSTKLNLSVADQNRLSKGYDGNGNKTPNQPLFLLGADGYVKSTIPDLINYIKFQLNNSNAIALESRTIINEMKEPMGYFWHIEKQPEATYYIHAGTAIGTTTWLIICPEKNIGVSVIINSRFSNSVDLVYNTAKHLISDLSKL